MIKLEDLVSLLNEQEVKQLRQGIIDLLLDVLKEDFDEYRSHNYLFDFEEMYANIFSIAQDEVGKIAEQMCKKAIEEAFAKKVNGLLEKV